MEVNKGTKALPIPGPPTPDPGTKHTRRIEMELFDNETGEVRTWSYDEPIRRRGPAAGRTTGTEFTIFYDEHLPRLFQLNGMELRVFLALVDAMGFNGPFRYSTAELAAEVDAPPASVSRSIGRLRQWGFVIEAGFRQVYLDPQIVWRGDGPDRKIAIDLLTRRGLLAKRIIPIEPSSPPTDTPIEGDTL